MSTPTMDRRAVAAALREIAVLVAATPDNRFRAKAYERAANAVESLTQELASLVASNALTTVPGIGGSIAKTIVELATTGRSQQLEKLRAETPPGVAELHPVLSTSRIKAVYDALGVTTLAELRAACEAGRLRTVRGFTEATERRLLEKIAAIEARGERVVLPEAERQADEVVRHLRAQPGVERVEIAGALRRRVETIDRLDVVVSATTDVRALAAGLPSATDVSDDVGGAFVVRRAGALDVRVQSASPEHFAPVWVHATGTEEHLAALVARPATRRRLRTEADVYAARGLPFIPPELREGAGEIEAAADGTLPGGLLRVEDVVGAVHCHTDWSDGRNTIEEMARAADALGLRYLTVTDHSASATYASGLTLERLRRQGDEIARVQETVRVRLLRGTESDILRDGALDFPDDVLARLDVVIASVHNRHGLDAAQMTKRLERAMAHPVFKIWGHALGRYVLSRPPFACDVERILDVVAASRAAIEVNGDPNRLDLAPPWIRSARGRGIPFVVSTDAHSTRALDNVRYGVDMARRGWLRPADVLNTRDTDAFVAAVRPG
jgi:DNA polymerase (family X)